MKLGEIIMSQNEDTKVNTGAAVLAEVADALKSSAGVVRNRLVTALTERELVKRVDLLDKALVKRRDLQRDLNKIQPKKPFMTFLDGKMVEVAATYTPEEAKQFEKQRKEASEKLAKFDAALEKAFGGEDFDKLANLLGGKSEESTSE